MDRLTILVGRLYKSAPPTNYFFKVPLVGRFVPLVGGIGRPVESPLQSSSTILKPILVLFLIITIKIPIMIAPKLPSREETPQLKLHKHFNSNARKVPLTGGGGS